MKQYYFPLICILSVCISLQAQNLSPEKDKVYIFSYFKGNGENGLHLAFSHDGYTFTALNKDSSLLRPIISKDKLMRDPCIIRGADNLFHIGQ